MNRVGEIDAQTKLLAIIGKPVGHSKSPQMHRCFSELCGLNYIYTAFNVEPEQLGAAIDGIRALGIAGVNVTAPYKFEVMQYLDEISDAAKKLGSVNTVVNTDGRLIGYNTDAEGFYRSLLRADMDIKDKDVLIFGAGGATQPIVVRFAELGAKSITVLNRTPERAQRLAEYVYSVTGFRVNTTRTLKHYDVVINTTSAGMAPQLDALPCENMDFIDAKTDCVDMIYNPWQTRFLTEAKKRGARTLNGLGMLIYQGILAFEYFTQTKLPPKAYEAAEKVVMPQ